MSFYYALLKEFTPLLFVPCTVYALSAILKLMRGIMRGAYTTDIAEELEKGLDEQIRKEEERSYIDDDLKKYFDYKE